MGLLFGDSAYAPADLWGIYFVGRLPCTTFASKTIQHADSFIIIFFGKISAVNGTYVSTSGADENVFQEVLQRDLSTGH